MTAFIARRIAWSVPTLLGIALLTFALIHLAPGGPEYALGGEKASPAQLAHIRHSLGFDRPLTEQCWLWLRQLLHGDLGFSYARHETVASLIAQRLPRTLLLTASALALTLVVAVPLGVLQAMRAGSRFDRAASIAVFVGASMPTFWLGTIAIALFAVTLGWFPVGGLQTIDTERFDVPSRLAHLVLPACTLAVVSIAGWSRYIRGSVAEEFGAEYVRTATAKGLSPRRVAFRHVLRNALLPFVTLLGGVLPALFGGAVITEQIFAYPGLGQLFWQSAVDRDFATILGMTVFTGALVILGNLLADVLYALVDPRVRYE